MNEKKTYKQKYRKRLNINISDEIHERLNKMSRAYNISMTTYTLQALAERIARDEQYN